MVSLPDCRARHGKLQLSGQFCAVHPPSNQPPPLHNDTINTSTSFRACWRAILMLTFSRDGYKCWVLRFTLHEWFLLLLYHAQYLQPCDMCAAKLRLIFHFWMSKLTVCQNFFSLQSAHPHPILLCTLRHFGLHATLPSTSKHCRPLV